MLYPGVHDTIVAISSAWEPAPVGVVRLSGPQALSIAAAATAHPEGPASTGLQSAGRSTRISVLGPDGPSLPAWLAVFRGPRSYTGQDLVEFHTIGCLPLLRQFSESLLRRGARWALPGEFTARAFLNGRLNAQQVDGVLALIEGEDAAELRRAARGALSKTASVVESVCERLLELLARVEAGIDFVDEEGVEFIAAAELRAVVRDLIGELALAGAGGPGDATSSATPHVAIVGRPNAGKSTLFNALLGRSRAIVSPIMGTTRDVLTATTRWDGMRVVLQDCAGLGETRDDLERAAHRAAERAAALADLVLWVHPCDEPWRPDELAAIEAVDPRRRVLVHSKLDRATAAPPPPNLEFACRVAVCAWSGIGLSELTNRCRELLVKPGGTVAAPSRDHQAALVSALQQLEQKLSDGQTAPELLAIDLREACTVGRRVGAGPSVEEVLGRIFARFCVGK